MRPFGNWRLKHLYGIWLSIFQDQSKLFLQDYLGNNQFKMSVWAMNHYFGIKSEKSYAYTTIKTKKCRVIHLTPWFSLVICESRIINMHIRYITRESLRICLLKLIQKGVLQCLLLPFRPWSSVLTHHISILL